MFQEKELKRFNIKMVRSFQDRGTPTRREIACSLKGDLLRRSFTGLHPTVVSMNLMFVCRKKIPSEEQKIALNFHEVESFLRTDIPQKVFRNFTSIS